ncbi:GAF domain-containing sensor histidine kinase [Leptospira bouyouniensis]|uniref:GAF domain-containing sensor histidine kinase n=1 Tax=Leptospira bouyouniensis TaxID=2484911 RepID=UPI0010916AFD|nr:ATP-binding protein [Leptospira bouyouniensis]TGM81024.1 GAF domain-containing protein [Leptospira bouyouniensis]
MDRFKFELTRARLKQNILAQVSSHPCARTGDIQTLAKFITNSVSDILEIERVGVWLFNETKNELVNVDTYLRSQKTHSSGAILKENEFKEEFQYLVCEKYVDANDPYTDPRTKGFIESYLKPNGITAMLDGVIRMGEELIGTLCFEHVGKKHKWSEDEITFCSQLGDQIALAISNQRNNIINQELISRENELRELNESLERLVEERTKKLKKSNEELELTISTLKKAQNQLVLSEKMASLGQLVAGIAHEINNPIAAIQASAENLKESLFESELSPFQKELKEIIPDYQNQKQFLDLIQILKSRIEIISGRDRMNRRKRIESWLGSKGIDKLFSNHLIDTGFDLDLLDQCKELFESEKLESILTLLVEEITVYQSLHVMLLAVERASKMTFALKNFVRFEISKNPVRVNLKENIETVLTLYQNQFKKKVTLVKEYEDVPYIEGYPEELLHLWTNLIYNALQAMSFHGKLSIQTKTEGNKVLVLVEDNGSGIPETIQHRIFEPFFTTKPLGEGSGLGLDICRKIVDRHFGSITFQSIPGKTIFAIELPIKIPN